MKHIVVKPKTTFQRFAKRTNVKIFGTPHVHMCDGTKRGAKFKHTPVKLHLSGTALSGVGARIIRYECPLCGMKTTYGRNG